MDPARAVLLMIIGAVAALAALFLGAALWSAILGAPR